MSDVDLEAVYVSKRRLDGRSLRALELPGGAALGAVQVAVLLKWPDVELLAAIGTVAMADQAELLEHIERPIHRGWDRGGVPRATALHELRAGDMPIGLSQDLDHRPALGSPAQAALTEAIAHGVPGVRQ